VGLTSKVGFSAPGRYVLRAAANDGLLFTSRDVTVTVSPSVPATLREQRASDPDQEAGLGALWRVLQEHGFAGFSVL
jgi:hypothetical protein